MMRNDLLNRTLSMSAMTSKLVEEALQAANNQPSASSPTRPGIVHTHSTFINGEWLMLTVALNNITD